MKNTFAAFAVPFLVLAGFLSAWIVWFEVHPTMVDVFLFKEAGVQWALNGVFEVKNLPHMVFDEARTYAYYPPIYPFAFGVWVKIFGVSLKSSIAFDQAIKVLRTLAMAWAVWPWMKNVSSLQRVLQILALTLLTLGPLQSDRPDDLAMLFGLLALGLQLRSFKHAWISGVLLAMCYGTSPAGGVFFTLIILATEFKKKFSWQVILSSIVAFGLILSPVLLSDNQAFARFGLQLPLSFIPLRGLPMETWVREWLQVFWFGGKSILVTFLALAAAVLFCGARGVLGIEKKHFFVVTILAGLLGTLVWTYQPRYLWFPSVVLYGCLLVSATRETNRFWRAAAIVALFFVLAPTIKTEAIVSAFAVDRKHSRYHDEIRQVVLGKLQPGQRLAVTSDHYFTFRPFHEVDMAYYVCRNIDRYDFVFIGWDQVRTETIEPPCHGKRGLFKISSFTRGGVLFQRRSKSESIEQSLSYR